METNIFFIVLQYNADIFLKLNYTRIINTQVVRITKDLLEIRNLEIKQLENKISAIEGKMKCEHERYDLMHKKLEQMIRHNGELKREYETQLCLFSALRQRYSERELAKDVVDDLKEGIAEEKNKTEEESRSVVQPDEQTDESLHSEQPPADQGMFLNFQRDP